MCSVIIYTLLLFFTWEIEAQNEEVAFTRMFSEFMTAKVESVLNYDNNHDNR